MKLRKFFNLMFAALFVLSLLPAAALAQEEPATQPIATIESELLDALSQGPADFVVEMAEKADLSKAYDIDDWDARGWFVYNALQETAERTQAQAKAYLDKAGLRSESYFAGNEIYVRAGDLQAVNSLAALPEVAVIRQPRTAYVDPVVSEGSVASPGINAVAWGIDWVEADLFWSNFGIQGEGVIVANIDTGVQWNHPALDQAYKCAANPTDPACWLDPSNSCGGTVCDNNGHGTHTMGTMVADDDPTLTWQAGMAPGAQFIMCKGCESSSCSEASLLACGDWIVAPGGDPANRPHVVNNSWGGRTGTCDTWYLSKVQAWRAAGVFPAFSAGNSGSSCSTLGVPGVYQESFATGGFDSSGNTYTSSSRGPAPTSPPACDPHTPYTKPNIAAPAVSVCSTVPGNGWSCSYTGTSMASPHSAGAVALLWACNPSLIGQIDQTFEILQDSADGSPTAGNCGTPPDGEGDYTHGYGYLDVNNAGMLWCGDTGYLDGHVYDAVTSSPIANATVNAGGPTATTDATGYYTMTLLVGTYTVTATHPLYTGLAIPGVVITADNVTTQNFNLQPRGRLWGYVTDEDSGAPLEATVVADDGTSANTDPATGMYEMYLDAGTYDVTASAADYADETAQVSMTSGTDTRQDFDLLAAIAVVPDPIAITLELDTTGSVGAVMTNNMAVDYPFEFRIMTPLEEGIQAEDVLVVRYDTAAADAMQAALTTLGYTYLGVTASAFEAMAVPDLLQYQAVFYAGIPYSASQAKLIAFLDAGGSLYVSDNDVGYSQGSTAFYQTYLQSTYLGDNGGDILLGENIMSGMTLDITPDPYPDYFTVGAEGTRIFQFQGNGNAGGVALDRNGYLAIYTSFDFDDINTAAQEIEVVERVMDYLGSGGEVAWFVPDIMAGTVPAGDSLDWTNDFYATAAAGILQPGMYEATLRVKSTTPGLPQKDVSVVMEVTPPSSFGQVEGTVTSDRTGEPLEAELLIEASGGATWTLTTDPATGYYSYWLDAGTYDVTAHVDGYIDETASVDVTAGSTTVQDFQLELDEPWLVFEPASFEQSLEFGQTATDYFIIHNLGPQPLEWEIVEADKGMTPLAASIALVSDNDALTNITFILDELDLDYDVWNNNGTSYYMADPGFLAQYSFIIWYASGSDGYGRNITQAEHDATAAWIDAGGNLLVTGYDTLGSPTDPLLADLVRSSTSGDGPFTANYSIVLDHPITNGPFGAYPPGTALVANSTDHDTAEADTARGAVTVAQMTGYTADKIIATETPAGGKVVYWNGNQNVTDWSAVAQGALAEGKDGVQASGGVMSIQGQNMFKNTLDWMAAGDVLWLAQDPISGTIPAYSSFTGGEVHFDAGTVAEPGIYMAELRVRSNDPLGTVIVPVTMTVTPGADIGKLEGTVIGTGYCDGESYPLEAELLIEASDGMTYSLVTDQDTGYYYRWLAAGTYTVTFSAPEHVGVVDVVDVLDGGTTTLDVALRYIESCMDVTPLEFSLTLPPDTEFVDTLTIWNNGAGELMWQIRETTATMQLVNEDVLVQVPAIAARSDVASRSGSGAQPAREFNVHVGWVSADIIDVLIVTPDVVGGGDISLILNTLAVFPDLNVVVWDGNAGTPSVAAMQAYDVVFVGNDILWTSSAIDKIALSNNLADYIDAGGKVAAGGFIWSYDEWGMSGGRFMTDDYSPYEMASIDIWTPTTLGAYDAAHPIMAGITNVTDGFNHQNPPLSSTGTWVASWADGQHFVAVSPNCVGLNQVYFQGAIFGGQVGELLHNAFLYLVGGEQEEWIDVPWVSEVPTTGVTLPYDAFEVDVVFDTTGLTVGECYTAALGIFHDDPGWASPSMVPLELCVASQWPVFTLTKTVEPLFAYPGDVVTYTITAGNDGDAATGVTVGDFLPDEVALKSASAGYQYDEILHHVYWDPVTLDAGEYVEFTVVVTVAETVVPPVTVVNAAYLDWGVEHRDASAPLDIEQPPLVPVFSLEKAVTPAEASPGDVVTYTITFNNTGDPVSDVSVNDNLPDGVTFVYASDGGVYNPTSGNVLWSNLSVDSTVRTFTLSVRIDASTPTGVLTNSVRLNWNGEPWATDAVTFEVIEPQPTMFYFYLPLTYKN